MKKAIYRCLSPEKKAVYTFLFVIPNKKPSGMTSRRMAYHHPPAKI
jgi:hypothetical protein